MVLTNPEQVTPNWLTEVLGRAGALQRGVVAAIERDSQAFNTGFLSNIATLSIRYSAEAAGTLPGRLFLKMTKPGLHQELLSRGRHEVEFYQAMDRAGYQLSAPQCYDAQYDGSSQLSHILMEDLSASHFQKPQPIPPATRQCELIMESLAHLHAGWWNSPKLGAEMGRRLTEEDTLASQQRLEATLPMFMDYLGDAFLPHQRLAYERIMGSDFLRRHGERLRALRGVTLVHGDAHTGNLMLPNDPQVGRVLLVDWHLWDINLPSFDLAFLMALHWQPTRRALLEKPLLRHYHQTLITDGVKDYAWEALWDDYRRSVIIMTLIPIGQFRRQSPAGVIWFGLQDSLAAFDDLDCAELL